MGHWIKVYKTSANYKAEIVRDILSNSGLAPVIINKKESATQIGFCEVHVIGEEVLKAKKIIDDEIVFE